MRSIVVVVMVLALGGVATADQQQARQVTAPVVAPDRGRSERLAGIVVADVGVGVVALGVIFAILSKQAGDSAYRPASGVYDPYADDRQTSYRNADIACFVVGGVAVAAGTTLWMLGRRKKNSANRATLAPTVGSAALKVSF